MRTLKTPLIMALALTGLLAVNGCTDGGGGNDGGQDGHTELCGQLPCAGSEACVNNSMCVSRPDQAAEAFEEVWLSDDEKEFQSRGAADLTCHNAEACSADADCPSDASGAQLACNYGFCGQTAPAGVETVTFRGCVDAFGIGDVTNNMRVALYTADQNPTGASQWDMASGEDRDGCRYWGTFEFTDVPTNTPLILKTYDPDNLFLTTYKYNVVLWADLSTDEGGTAVFDTRTEIADPRTGQTVDLNPWRAYAISSTTYDVILMAVSISELPETQGAIAGTVRDCGYHEIKNVRCAAVDRPTKLTYFTDAENPRPDRSRESTNANGIYAAIGLEEGQHRVSCLAQDENGDAVPLGEYAVQVFPHGVTILSFDWYPGL